MKKSVLYTVLATVLLIAASGCTHLEFKVVGQENGYADRPFLLSSNNRLVDLPTLVFGHSAGLFANPAYVGKSWYLIFENVQDTDHESDGDSRLKLMNTLQVTADGQRFDIGASEAFHLDRKSTRQNFVDFWRAYGLRNSIRREVATFRLTTEQFRSLFEAGDLQITLVGGIRKVHIGGNELASSFQSNLHAFYQMAASEPRQPQRGRDLSRADAAVEQDGAG